MNNPFLEAAVSKAEAARFKEIAGTWNILQNYIGRLEEDELAKLLKWELNNQRRMYVINKIKSRHSRLRDTRERKEILP
jgi:hypothetical protein